MQLVNVNVLYREFCTDLSLLCSSVVKTLLCVPFMNLTSPGAYYRGPSNLFKFSYLQIWTFHHQFLTLKYTYYIQIYLL